MSAEVTYRFLEELAEKHDKKLADMLSMISLQKIASILSGVYPEGGNDALFLTNITNFLNASKGERFVNKLEMIYVGDKQMKEVANNVMLAISGCEIRADFDGKPLIRTAIRLVSNLYIRMSVSNVSIPMEIEISKYEGDISIGDKVVTYDIIDGSEISVPRAPVEIMLSRYFREIYTKLELIGDLAPYFEVDHILSQETVSGRKIRHIFGEMGGSIFSGSSLNMIESYKTYRYMLNRFKSYTKGKKIKNASWEDMIEKQVAFMSPIVDAIERDIEFFGDWMPDIGRFLD